MKKLIFKSLSMENWRGMTMTVKFKDGNTIIRGFNGTGKSHIGDAIHWIFEGVDAQNRTNYELYDNLKPMTVENSQPAIVEIIADYDGVEYSFKRSAKQKWVRKRNKAEYEKAASDEYLYYLDGLAVSANNYWERIENMFAPIEKMKLMLNLRHYRSLDWKVLRKHFADIVGTIAENELQGDYSSISTLLDKFDSVENVKEKLSQESAPLRKAQYSLESEIKGKTDSLPVISNVSDAENKAEDIRKAIAEIDSMIMGLSAANDPYVKKRNEELQAIESLRCDIYKARKEWDMVQNEPVERLKREIRGIILRNKEIELTNIKALHNQRQLKAMVESAVAQSEFLKSELERLRAENIKIKARFFEDKLTCPKCGQPLPEDKIAEVKEAFYKKKESDHQDCVTHGIQMKERYEQQLALVDSLEKQLADLDEVMPLLDISDLERQLEKAKSSVVPFDQSDEYKGLNDKLLSLESNLTEIPQVETSELIQRKNQLMEELSAQQSVIAKKSLYDNIMAQIEIKREELSNTAIELARIDGLIAKCVERDREWASIVRERVNRHLTLCSVEMIEFSKGGEKKDVCTVSVRGVNAGVANEASKDIAGIDIAVAFQKHYGLNLPLFIDNAESICDSNIPDLDNQIILTYVDPEALTLTVV